MEYRFRRPLRGCMALVMMIELKVGLEQHPLVETDHLGGRRAGLELGLRTQKC